MTRTDFLGRLRRGLVGLPQATIEEAVADYDSHFDAGAEAGRSEAEIAAALGDPDRLARELRMEHGLRAWDERKNPSAAAGAVFAVLGLGAIDILILLPILSAVVSVLVTFFGLAIGGVIFGGVLMVGGPFWDPPGGPMTAILGGIGVAAASVAVGALTAVLSVWLVNALVWFGRLHYRLLKPALDNASAPSASNPQVPA